MHHPFDLAQLIHGDHLVVQRLFERLAEHQGDRSALLEQLIFNLNAHGTAEEQVVYPAMRELLIQEEDVDEAVDDHFVIKQALVQLEESDDDPEVMASTLRALSDVVSGHVAIEEQRLLADLRVGLGDDGMMRVGREFIEAQRRAPSRPHADAPSGVIATAAAAVVDRFKDRLRGRDALVATDASGLLGPQAQEVIDQWASYGPKPLHLLEPDQARRQPTLGDAASALTASRDVPGPEQMASIDHRVIDGPDGDITMRIYRPLAAVSLGIPVPIVIYVHGGGWVIGDMDTYDASARGLAARTGYLVVSVEYRHAPEFPFPAAHDDVLHASRWIMANASSFDGDATRICMVGESAGGNMVASTCLSMAAAGERLPLMQVLVYPVTSTSMDSPSYREAVDARPLNAAAMNWFFGQLIGDDPGVLLDPRLDLMSVAPERLAALPSTVVVTAERDPLRDEGEAFAGRLAACGVAVQQRRYNMVPHEFFGLAAVLDTAAAAQDEVASLLRSTVEAAIRPVATP